jgi:4-nitrophenyl phosphatase
VYFATNNSSASRAEYVARLERLQLGGDVDHVVTSAYATAHYLDRLEPRPRDVLVLGGDGLREEIRAVGIAVRDPKDTPGIHPSGRAAIDGLDPAAMRLYLTSLELPPPPDTVVVGLDMHMTYAKLAEAQRAVLAGARFIASNKDRAYPVEGRLLPGAGTIVAAIEVATGRAALCIGKPEPWLFQEALNRAGPLDSPEGSRDSPGGSRDRVVVIGDSTDYDIVAAHRVGAVGVLITTGLTEPGAESAATGEAVPDHVISSLDQLFALPAFAGA